MLTWIIIFYASLIGMAAVIMIKRREMSSGQPSVLCCCGRKTDRFLTKISDGISLIFSFLSKKTMIALAHVLAYHVLLRVRNIYVGLKHRVISNPHGKKLIDAVRGRGEVKYHGASFYLRRIGDK